MKLPNDMHLATVLLFYELLIMEHKTPYAWLESIVRGEDRKREEEKKWK